MSLSARLESRAPAFRLLLTLLLTISLTIAGLALLAALCWYLVPPLKIDDAFDAQVTIVREFFYAGQPAKTMAYDLDCLAAPGLFVASYFLIRNWVAGLAVPAVIRQIKAGIAIYWFLFLCCLVPLVYCPHPALWMIPPNWLLLPFPIPPPFVTPLRLFFLILGPALGFLVLGAASTRKNLDRVTVLLVLAWAVLMPTHFYPPVELGDELRFTYNLNSVLSALSQSSNGHHLLIDFTHIYGGYVEILAPLARLLPRSIATLLFVIAFPSVLSVLFLLLTARLVIRQPFLLLLTGSCLLSVEFLTSSVECNYAYNTARMFFPSMGLFAATLYLRSPSRRKYLAVSLIAAIASIWNLDSGLVLWMSWLITLATVQLNDWKLVPAARQVAVQIAFLIGIWTVFFLYLRVVSGEWPDPDMLFYFQKFVLGSGYFCLRMLFPDIWVLVATIYAMGLGTAIVFYLHRTVSWKTHFVLMVSVLGIGLFSYFTGRSAETYLLEVSYPAVLLIGVFLDEGRLLIARDRLPRLTRGVLLPTVIPIYWWCFLLLANLPNLLEQSVKVCRDWNTRSVTPFERNSAFVQAQTSPREKGVYFLSDHSGIYYYLSDTTYSPRIPGTIELMRTADMDSLISAIESKSFSKLFVEENFYKIEMYKPAVYQQLREAISSHYRAVVTSETGQVVLYVPR